MVYRYGNMTIFAPIIITHYGKNRSCSNLWEVNGFPPEDEQTLVFLAMIYEYNVVNDVEPEMEIYAHIEQKEIYKGTIADVIAQYGKYLDVEETK